MRAGWDDRDAVDGGVEPVPGQVQMLGVCVTSYIISNIMTGRRRGDVRASEVSAADIPSLIRNIRVARGLTQEALAREIGVTFSTVNGWENGRHQPIPALIAKLLDTAGAAGLVVRAGRRPPRVPVRTHPGSRG
jgi:DNA-binding transcriptional regulator YiaG